MIFNRTSKADICLLTIIALAAFAGLGVYSTYARQPRTDGAITVEFSAQGNADMQTNMQNALSSVTISSADTNVAAKLTTINSTLDTNVAAKLTTINSTLGTPLQEGGSVNTADTNVVAKLTTINSTLGTPLQEGGSVNTIAPECTPYTFVSTGTQMTNNIFAVTKLLHGWSGYNTNSYPVVVYLYDQTSPAQTNHTPKVRIFLPPNDSGNNYQTEGGWRFTNGVTMALGSPDQTVFTNAPASSVGINLELE